MISAAVGILGVQKKRVLGGGNGRLELPGVQGALGTFQVSGELRGSEARQPLRGVPRRPEWDDRFSGGRSTASVSPSGSGLTITVSSVSSVRPLPGPLQIPPHRGQVLIAVLRILLERAADDLEHLVMEPRTQALQWRRVLVQDAVDDAAVKPPGERLLAATATRT